MFPESTYFLFFLKFRWRFIELCLFATSLERPGGIYRNEDAFAEEPATISNVAKGALVKTDVALKRMETKEKRNLSENHQNYHEWKNRIDIGYAHQPIVRESNPLNNHYYSIVGRKYINHSNL